jgi:hypothetical protein
MAKSPKLREQELHYFWKHSRYFSQPLLSTQKHQIEVIHRGRYNLDAGPDFISAVFKIDEKLYEGDVEIHLDARDWLAHGHHTDPAYNRVLLHLSLDLGTSPKELFCENSRELLQLVIPVTALPTRKAGKIQANENLLLAFCPLRNEPLPKITTTVMAAGKMRFQQKTAQFREQIHETSWDQLLYRGISEALGYAKNQKPFRQLAERVPIDLLFNELRNLRAIEPGVFVPAILFGAAGLLKFPERGACDAEVAAYLSPRVEIWRTMQHTLQIHPLPEASWQFFRLRPQNFPTRRIAALAELILRFYRIGMLETFAGILSENRKNTKIMMKALRELLTVAANGFWKEYFDFKSKIAPGVRSQPGALLGEKMADEIVVNIILPVVNLFAQESGNAILSNRVMEVYAACPRLQSNVVTRKMQKQLFGNGAQKGIPPAGSEYQQGLIHLHKNYCLPLKCEECLAITSQA